MGRIALLSNPKASGNQSQLPRIRNFCAEHLDIFEERADVLRELAQYVVERRG